MDKPQQFTEAFVLQNRKRCLAQRSTVHELGFPSQLPLSLLLPQPQPSQASEEMCLRVQKQPCLPLLIFMVISQPCEISLKKHKQLEPAPSHI